MQIYLKIKEKKKRVTKLVELEHRFRLSTICLALWDV